MKTVWVVALGIVLLSRPCPLASQTGGGCAASARLGLGIPLTDPPFGPGRYNLQVGPGGGLGVSCGAGRGVAGGVDVEFQYLDQAVVTYALAHIGFQTRLGKGPSLGGYVEGGVARSRSRGSFTLALPNSGHGALLSSTGFTWGIGARTTAPIGQRWGVLVGVTVRTTYLDRVRYPSTERDGVTGVVTIPITAGVWVAL